MNFSSISHVLVFIVKTEHDHVYKNSLSKTNTKSKHISVIELSKTFIGSQTDIMKSNMAKTNQGYEKISNDIYWADYVNNT